MICTWRNAVIHVYVGKNLFRTAMFYCHFYFCAMNEHDICNTVQKRELTSCCHREVNSKILDI